MHEPEVVANHPVGGLLAPVDARHQILRNYVVEAAFLVPSTAYSTQHAAATHSRLPASHRRRRSLSQHDRDPRGRVAAPRTAPPSGTARRLTFLFAAAAGAAIANLYRAQPLAGFIAGDLHAATATPADSSPRPNSGTPSTCCCSASSWTAAGSSRAGPHTARQEPGRRRPSRPIVGIVGSGTITGILASRTVSGFVAGAAGWRATFALAVFSLFWTALTFLLSEPPFLYPLAVIGSFGVSASPVSLPACAVVVCTTTVGRFRPPARPGCRPSPPTSSRRSPAGPSYLSSSPSS